MRRVYQCVVGVLVVMLAAAGCTFFTQQAQRSKESQSARANPSDTTTTEPAQSTRPSQTTTQPVATRLDITGSGSKTTEKFTVGPEWTVEWSYECSGQAAQLGIFQVWPKGDENLDLLPIMTSPGAAKASDTQNYHKAGEFYLDILSSCDWTIVVRG